MNRMRIFESNRIVLSTDNLETNRIEYYMFIKKIPQHFYENRVSLYVVIQKFMVKTEQNTDPGGKKIKKLLNIFRFLGVIEPLSSFFSFNTSF